MYRTTFHLPSIVNSLVKLLKDICIAALILFSFQISYAKINENILRTIFKKAKESHTDGLIILYDGKIIAEYYSPQEAKQIYTASITKSVVNLAIGLLLSQRKLTSIDQYIYEFYPEWKQGKKKYITIAHILNHTSGLQDLDSVVDEINPAPDVIQLALTAELMSNPGTQFFYSNKAVNLLSGIVQKITGKKLDVYLNENLFKPLEIKKFTWNHDKAGNPYANADLSLMPKDLAKIGQLVLQKGKWQGKQLIDNSWFDISLKPSQKFNKSSGLLWWLIPDPKKKFNEIIGYYAEGYRGQYLVIYPEKKLVGVRMIHPWTYKIDKDKYDEFKNDVCRLVQ